MNKNQKGFTLVELIVVIVIIGILSSIGVYSYARSQSVARDSQRSSQIAIIAESLEKYYVQNGEYPSCADMTASSDSLVTNTLKDLDRNVLSAPNATSGTNSFICSDPTADNFSYIGGGDEYTLEYLSEVTKTTVSVNSVHAPLKIEVPSTPSLSVTDDSLYVTATISAATCTIGTAQYGIRSRINDGAWSDYSVWDISTTQKVKSEGTYGYKFDFQAQARCYTDSTTYSDAVISAEQTYIKPFITPSAPTVSNSTYGSTTTWSWPDVTCYHGTANYQYDYSTTYGYDSGWINKGTDLSITFTTATGGETYTVAVQANCSSAYTTSDWSASGSKLRYVNTGVLVALATPTIATGTTPFDISLTADDAYLYVTNEGDNTISAYSRNSSDRQLYIISGSWSTGTYPYSIYVPTVGNSSVYVANKGSANVSNYTYSASSGRLTLSNTVSDLIGPAHIVGSPDGKTIYTANYDTNNVAVYGRDTTTGNLTSIGTIAAGTSPLDIIMSNDGTSVYVANFGSNSISMYSRNSTDGTLTSIGTIAAGTYPKGIAISPDGNTVYATSFFDRLVSIYNRNASTGALTLNSTIATGTGPYGITVSPDGLSVYVANYGGNTISTYRRDSTNGSLSSLGDIAAGGVNPTFIAISSDGSSAYITNGSSNTISMFKRN